LLEKKAEILERRSKELELLKMDSLEGLIKKALVEKEKYAISPFHFTFLFLLLLIWFIYMHCFLILFTYFREIDQLNSELLRVEEDSHWLQVRLDLAEKNISYVLQKVGYLFLYEY
jgi:hypothetical protein